MTLNRMKIAVAAAFKAQHRCRVTRVPGMPGVGALTLPALLTALLPGFFQLPVPTARGQGLSGSRSVDLRVSTPQFQPAQVAPGSEFQAEVFFKNNSIRAAEAARVRIQPPPHWRHVVWQTRWDPALASLEPRALYQRAAGSEGAVGAPSAVAVTRAGDFAYVASGHRPSALLVLALNGGGDEGPASPTRAFQFVQALNNEEVPVNCRDLLLSPDERFLYATAPGSNSLVVLSRNRADGTLTPMQVVQAENSNAPLLGVSHLVIAPDGRHLFASSPLQGAIAVFARNPEDGQLSFRGAFDGSNGIQGLRGLRSLALDSRGRHLYAASYREPRIFGFRIEPTSGELTLVQSFHAAALEDGEGPAGAAGLKEFYDLVLSPDGRFVYAAAFASDSLAVFWRHPESGRLRLTSIFDDQSIPHAGTASALDGPRALAWPAESDRLYVVSQFADTLAEFEPLGNGRLRWAGALRDGSAGLTAMSGPNDLALSADGAVAVVTAENSEAVLAFTPRDQQLITSGTGTVNQEVTLPQGVGLRYTLKAFLADDPLPENATAVGSQREPAVLRARISAGADQVDRQTANNQTQAAPRLRQATRGEVSLTLRASENIVRAGDTAQFILNLKNESPDKPITGALTLNVPPALSGPALLREQNPAPGSVAARRYLQMQDARQIVPSPDGRFLYVLEADRERPFTKLDLPIEELNRENAQAGAATEAGEGSPFRATPLRSPVLLRDLHFLPFHERAVGLAADRRELLLFRRNPFTGMLRFESRMDESQVGLPQGSGIGRLIVEPNSGSLMVLAEQVPRLTVLAWAGEAGQPLEIPRIAANLDLSSVTTSGGAGLRQVAFSPNGKWLALGGEDVEEILVFGLAEGASSLRLRFRLPEAGSPRHLLFSPDSRRLLALTAADRDPAAPADAADPASSVARAEIGQWILPEPGSGAELLYHRTILESAVSPRATLFFTHEGSLFHVVDPADDRHWLYAAHPLSPQLREPRPGPLQGLRRDVVGVLPLPGSGTRNLCVLVRPPVGEAQAADGLLLMRLQPFFEQQVPPRHSPLSPRLALPPGGQLTYTLSTDVSAFAPEQDYTVTADFSPDPTEARPPAQAAPERPRGQAVVRVRRAPLLEADLALKDPESAVPGSPLTLALTLRNRGDVPARNHVLKMELPEELREVQWTARMEPPGESRRVSRQLLPGSLPLPDPDQGLPARSTLLLSADGRQLYVTAGDAVLLQIPRNPANGSLGLPVAMSFAEQQGDEEDLEDAGDAGDAGVPQAQLADAQSGSVILHWAPRGLNLRVLSRNATSGLLSIARQFNLRTLPAAARDALPESTRDSLLRNLRQSYLIPAPDEDSGHLLVRAPEAEGGVPRVLAKIFSRGLGHPSFEILLNAGANAPAFADYALAGDLTIPAVTAGDPAERAVVTGRYRYRVDPRTGGLLFEEKMPKAPPSEGKGSPRVRLDLASRSTLVLEVTGRTAPDLRGNLQIQALAAKARPVPGDPEPRSALDFQPVATLDLPLEPRSDLQITLSKPDEVILDREFPVTTRVKNLGPSTARDVYVLQRGRTGMLYLRQEGLQKKGFPVEAPPLAPGEELVFKTIYDTPLGQSFSSISTVEQYLSTDTLDPHPANNADSLRREVLVPLVGLPRPAGAGVEPGERVHQHLLLTLFEQEYSNPRLICDLEPPLRFEDAWVTGNPAESGGLLEKTFAGELPRVTTPREERDGRVILDFEELRVPEDVGYARRQFVVHLLARVDPEQARELPPGTSFTWKNALVWEELKKLPEVYARHATTSLPLTLHKPSLSVQVAVTQPAGDAGDVATYTVSALNEPGPYAAPARHLRFQPLIDTPASTWSGSTLHDDRVQLRQAPEQAELRLPALPPGELVRFSFRELINPEAPAGASFQGKIMVDWFSRGPAPEAPENAESGAATPAGQHAPMGSLTIQSPTYQLQEPSGMLLQSGPLFASSNLPVVYDLLLRVPEGVTRDLQLHLELPEHLEFEGATIADRSPLLPAPSRIALETTEPEVRSDARNRFTLELGTLRNPPNETPRDDHLLVELRTRLVAGTLREGEPIEPPRLTLRRAGGQPLPVEIVDPEGQHPVLGQPHIKIISLGKQAGGFQFLVTNEARDQAATAGPVRIDLELPGNLEFVSATASEGRLTARTHAGQVQLGLDRLVPGQSSIITLETTPSPEAAATAPETGDSGDSGANQPGSGRDSNGEDLG